MTTVNVYRKSSPKFSNSIRSNEEVGEILENPGESWTSLSQKLRGVADFVDSKDYGKSTILGKKRGFMTPFVEALEVYQSLYMGADWCHTSKYGELLPLDNNPFETRDHNEEDPSFVEKIIVPEGTRCIVIGDIHSGLQSVVEIIDSLVSRGILDDELHLKSGYYMIFLGDVLDRGGLGLDIIHILFQMKVLNFQSMWIINGNHEDVSMYSRHGFGDEMEAQLEKDSDKNLIHNLLTHLPSAIYVNFQENNSWIQMNHGGIDPYYYPREFMASDYDFEFHGFDGEGGLETAGLRWNDFNGHVHRVGPSSRGGSVLEYGKEATEEYLNTNGLSGIVRGHQDFMHCAILEKYNGSARDMKPIHNVGMVYPQKEHWKEMLTDRWEHLSIPDAFRDFSVFTTSTAVRARDLGYHTYLELASSASEMRLSKSILNQSREQFDNFFRHIDLFNEFQVLMNAQPGNSVTYSTQEWKEAFEILKNQDEQYNYAFFHVFVLAQLILQI